MSNVQLLRPEAVLQAIQQARSRNSSNKESSTGNGNPPDNAGMEARVLKLEDFALETRDRLTRIETKLDDTATKADLADLRTEMHKGTADIVKWVVGTAVALGAVGITVMTFVLNNATPKAVAVAQPPAIIINVPANAPAPSPAPLQNK